ncbi:TROVE domain protein [Dictyocaulus viviparus]|uniref:TROVE domain protein n=1 Tax=Dictyocaulus viviparus TaxID=29172 RepID=A0A0D8XJ11_DICVI|nr:TROVE domain protein [Dictyocaulus viviparus]
MIDDDIDYCTTNEENINNSDTFMCNLKACEEYCRRLILKETPGQMIRTRSDEVCNSAGGFVFAVSDETRIRRFLILGTTGGTYYSSEKELTMENVNALIDIIEKGYGSSILKEIYEISLAGRNAKQDPLLLALALCASSEKELTMENVNALIDIIEKGYGSSILKEIYEISLAGRNAKQDPLLLALALCARYNVCQLGAAHSNNEESQEDFIKARHNYLRELHKSAFGIVNDVCRIPTQLFTFVKYCEIVSGSTHSNEGKKSTGWGRLMRNTVQRWYSSKTPEQLAMHLTKYPQRGGWSHRDLFRLAHPKLKISDHPKAILEYEQLYHFAVKGELKTRKRNLSKKDEELEQPASKYSALQMDTEMESSALDLVQAVIELKSVKDETKIVEAIKKHYLVREHIPTNMLNSIIVWQALLERMPITAMVRNLGKMQSIGVLTESYIDLVTARLTDHDELKCGRIHPIQVSTYFRGKISSELHRRNQYFNLIWQILMAKSVYESGHGFRGSLTWVPNKKIGDALEVAFHKSFVNTSPTNKRYCFAFDVSESMLCSISDTMLSCRSASAALSLVSLKNEKIVECVGFCHELIELPYNGEWTISRIEEHMDQLDYGATDCALPMLWAKQKHKEFDVFVILTDCETWFGDVHPWQALRDYRKSSGIIDAKLIVMGMTATEFTIADPQDAGMMDIVGFDPAVPTLLHNFVIGKI